MGCFDTLKSKLFISKWQFSIKVKLIHLKKVSVSFPVQVPLTSMNFNSRRN